MSDKRALADPAASKRRSEAVKRAWTDPEVRRRMSEAIKRSWDKRRLPEMTPEQRRLYVKLRPIVGREAALEEILGQRRQD